MSEMLLTAYDGAILGPIAKLLGWLMDGVYKVMLMLGINNVGLSIIIFTIIIYMLMFPLTYKQQKFSKLSQKMQPELQAVNKKYQGKKDQASMMAMQEETQAIYDKYGVSMTGSCVQLLIQMPLLFALYRVFLNVPAYVTSVKDNFSALVSGIMATEGYQEKMAQIVTDLKITTQPTADFTVTDTAALSNSIVDVLNKMNTAGWDTLKDVFPSLTDTISSTYETVSHVNNFLGMNIADSPWQIITAGFAGGSMLLAFAAFMIPVTSYLTQVGSMKLAQQNTGNKKNGNAQADAMAQQMEMMNKTMPLMSLFICFTVPVGLGIYWIMSAVVRIVQQYFLNKHFEKMDLEDIIKNNEEKAKKKREKMGIAENQISNAARMNTRTMVDKSKNSLVTPEKEAEIEKAREIASRAKEGSLTAKANLVRDYNERNNKK